MNAENHLDTFRFKPIIKNAKQSHKDLTDVYQAAKKMKDFFTTKNFENLKKLVEIINRIRAFSKEISQFKNLLKIIIDKRNNRSFKSLNSEFDTIMQELQFPEINQVIDLMNACPYFANLLFIDLECHRN
ncbi:5804_t:CDS:2 [Funneliformis geosporum]|uniref:5804_t:CDS:1 n=1 Tax=Funneliformis geosporum TaxID=1117311 RepID=A0A9W4SHL7_9GLOM|nr:5804_t:CDS:2 [Funneliformis geosporum]